MILSSSYFQGMSIHVFDVNSLCMYKQKDLSELVLYPKIFPPILFKVLTSIISICSSLLKGLHSQPPS